MSSLFTASYSIKALKIRSQNIAATNIMTAAMITFGTSLIIFLQQNGIPTKSILITIGSITIFFSIASIYLINYKTIAKPILPLMRRFLTSRYMAKSD